MTEAQLSRYADLMLWCVGGVGDQNLVVRLEPEGRDLAVALAETAYRDGARLVDLAYSDPLEVRARLAHGSDEAVEALPDYYRARYDEIARPEWTAIRIKGSAHPDALAGNDAARIGAYSRAHRATMERLAAETAAFRKAWVGVLFPTAAVATKAFPELDEAAALEAYEAALVRVLHLDDDPVSFWSDHFASLARRRDRYNALALDRLRFTGPGTDLEIGLHPGGRWQTAEETLVDGRTVRVNMPSCEIFTTPDLRRTSGRVASTRPFVSTSAPGRTIEGAWLEFRDGAVVDHGAAEGGDLLGRVLDMDAQARYLGEVALVDASSPVAAESMVFHDVLYDENAACHIALGYGFPGLVSGTDGLEGAALVERGVNHSLVHDDLMIGGGEVDVTGVTADGREVPIMRSGLFVGE
ncbi:MAG: aminopeptidase [Spirochaetota bacterium]